LKTIIAALAGASILTLSVPAAAQQHGGEGWGHGSSGSGRVGHSATGGNFPRGGFSSGGFAGRRFDGARGFRNFHDRSFAFAGLGLGFALGLSFYDPWYYDWPYYGYYAPYPSAPAYYDGYPPPPVAAPPPAAAAPPPAACGSWAWDSAKQTYNWVPC
jgi:hypothetical protein